MTATIRPLSPPHKGLRNLFSQFSLLSGVIQPGHAEHWNRWRKVGEELFFLLNDHAKNEMDHVFGPLHQRADSVCGDFQDEHQRLMQQARTVEQQFITLSETGSPGDFYGFYLDFSVFHAANLAMMAHEDRVVEPMLMQLFTDEELQTQQVRIMQGMSVETLLLWFKYIVPARQPAENLQVLRALSQTAPAALLDRVLGVLRAELNERDFEELASQL